MRVRIKIYKVGNRPNFNYSDFDIWPVYVNFEWQYILIENRHKGALGCLNDYAQWNSILGETFINGNTRSVGFLSPANAWEAKQDIVDKDFRFFIPAIFGTNIKNSCLPYTLLEFIQARWINHLGLFKYIPASKPILDDEFETAKRAHVDVLRCETEYANMISLKYGLSVDKHISYQSFIDCFIKIFNSKIDYNEKQQRSFAAYS